MSAKSKLKWRCRRGVKELDVVLTRFLETRYDDSSAEMHAAFDKLLDLQDPDILKYLLNQEQPEDKDIAGIIEELATLHST